MQCFPPLMSVVQLVNLIGAPGVKVVQWLPPLMSAEQLVNSGVVGRGAAGTTTADDGMSATEAV
jgi:hypothetical protein